MREKDLPNDHLSAWLGDSGQSRLAEKLTDALDELYADGPDEQVIKRARAKLEQALEEVLPPIVHYDLLTDTPLGEVWIAVNQNGLVAVEYALSEAQFIALVSKRVRARFLRSSAETKEAAKQVRAYLAGKSNKFKLGTDLSSLTDFQRSVLEATAKVPRGQVATYAEIADLIGKPRAVRAVGQALRRNPIPIVIPCHRVINSDGTLGGYGGKLGDRRKIKLLKLEGVMLA